MSNALHRELRQRKPFTSLAQEAHLSVSRTAAVLAERFEELLKPHGISPTQFNVLRILRGAEPDGLCRHEIKARLLSRMPDVTRLLDRMETAGLVVSERSSADRREVSTRLTARGRELVDALDEPVAAEHERRFGRLGEDDLRALVQLLAEVRQAA